MKTIIIGYEDAKGLGRSFVVCSLSVSSEKQMAVMVDAKRNHIFPRNAKRVAMLGVEELEVAILIDGETSAHLQERKKVDDAAQELSDKTRDESLAHQKLVESAEVKVTEIAKERNEWLGKKNDAQVSYRNGKLAQEVMPSKEADAQVKQAQEDLLVAVKKSEELIAAYDAAKLELDTLTKPKE